MPQGLHRALDALLRHCNIVLPSGLEWHLRRTAAGLAAIFTTRRLGEEPVLVLSVRRGWQSGMALHDPTALVFPYMRSFDAIFSGPRTPRRVLAIGGGGFSYPRYLAERGVAVDAVEIDPAVVAIAREFFHLEEAEQLRGPCGQPLLRVIVDDGARYLRRCTERYDALVIDAYQGMEEDLTLARPRVLALAKEHLAPGGVLVANVVTEPDDERALAFWVSELSERFAHVEEIPSSWGPEAYFKNTVVCASDAELSLAALHVASLGQ